MKTVEEYMEHLKTLEPAYHWPIESFEKKKEKRMEIRQEFPYVVTYQDFHSSFDTIEDWCREQFGDRHGECNWVYCEFGFEKWYEDNQFEKQLDKEILDKCGKRPNSSNKRQWNKWQKQSDKIIDEHYEKIHQMIDSHRDHSHKGTWTTLYLCKTGYDYGYQDFCFKNEEDAVYFKLIWDEFSAKK